MKRLPIDFLAEYDDASVLAELRRLADASASGSVTKVDIEQDGRVSYTLVVRRFGSLRRALQLAGLQPSRFMKASDDELLVLLVELWSRVLEEQGRTPQRRDLKTYGYPVSGDTFVRRFGSWRKALLKAHGSVTEKALGDQGTSRPTRGARH